MGNVRLGKTKIGRVKMKAGGADVRVLDRPQRDNTASDMIRASTMIADFFPDDMAGFVVVAWGSDGSHSMGYHVNTEKSPFGVGAIAAVVGDMIRRHLIEDGHWS